jgi:hypothetical protein
MIRVDLGWFQFCLRDIRGGALIVVGASEHLKAFARVSVAIHNQCNGDQERNSVSDDSV